MGAEKESKQTGFFNLFDWKTKPRKKLFANQFNHSEDDDRNAAKFSTKGDDTEDFSYCSSLADEDMYTSKSPGVVARLMGLKSLPISSDANSSPYLEAPQRKIQVNNSPDYEMILKPPMEKFQRELLPPKSARSIPITHHKLLSPVKCSGFRNSRVYIIEAAAKIIESNPQSLSNAKAPKVGSSSTPLKVANLREKLASNHTTSRINSSKGDNGKVEKVNERSISLAIQAKLNVQKRGMVNQRELKELQIKKLNMQSTNKEQNVKISASNSRGALKPNGLKQNRVLDENKSSSSNSKKPSSLKQRPSSKIEANKVEKGKKKAPRKKQMIEDKNPSNNDSSSKNAAIIEENKAVSFPLSLEGSFSEPKREENDVVPLTPISTPNETDTTSTSKAEKEMTSWELDYISKILSNLDKNLEDRAMGRISKVISPHLYEQMETRKYWRDSGGRTERKLVFDFVVQRVEKLCGFGRWKPWLRNSQRLVGGVYRELMTWKSMWRCTVDEVVEKDMSFLEGKWLDFEDADLSLCSDIARNVLDELLRELF